jgi:nitrous oxidase accessory protein
VEHDRGDGIRLFDSNLNRLERNRIESPRDGLYFEFAHHNYIADNEISHARIGLHYMYADDNEFEHNLFIDNGVAATPMYAKRIVARHNIFARSLGYGAYGLFLKDAEDVLVEENLVLDNQVGIFMDGSVRGKFVRNVVAANEVGLRILSSSRGNIFTGNAFVDNSDQVSLNPGTQDNRWDEGGTGNYWSDYRGYDLNGDGIGDIPHDATSVFAYLNESFPETRILHSSAPVQALAFAEELFPVLNLPRAMDRYPLMHAPSTRAPSLPLPAGTPATQVGSSLVLFGGLLLGGPLMLLLGARLFPRPAARRSRHP